MSDNSFKTPANIIARIGTRFSKANGKVYETLQNNGVALSAWLGLGGSLIWLGVSQTPEMTVASSIVTAAELCVIGQKTLSSSNRIRAWFGLAAKETSTPTPEWVNYLYFAACTAATALIFADAILYSGLGGSAFKLAATVFSLTLNGLYLAKGIKNLTEHYSSIRFKMPERFKSGFYKKTISTVNILADRPGTSALIKETFLAAGFVADSLYGPPHLRAANIGYAVGQVPNIMSAFAVKCEIDDRKKRLRKEAVNASP